MWRDLSRLVDIECKYILVEFDSSIFQELFVNMSLSGL